MKVNTPNILSKIVLVTLLPTLAFAGIKPEEYIIPGLRLRIEGETQLTDKVGVVLPEQVIKLPVGKLVTINRVDGFVYHGQVTEIEEGPDFYKVFGKILNSEDAGFGFAINKGGYFSGAIRERQANVTYVLEFNPTYKGFIFVRSFKHDKPSADNSKEDYQTVKQAINNIVEKCLQLTRN